MGKKGPRPGNTYRGTNKSKRVPMSKILKAQRRASGESRADAERRRAAENNHRGDAVRAAVDRMVRS